MQIVCNLSSSIELKDVKNYVDGVLIDDSEDLKKKINEALKYQVTPILKWNEMVLPNDISRYLNKIKETKDTGCMYYITDLGLAHMLKEEGVLDRVIYDPITMITNHLDAKEYASYGFHAVGMSNEITLEDMRTILSKSNIKVFLQVFGYRQVLHTRRNLISLYATKADLNLPKDNLFLEEATRKDLYPIYETKNGCRMFRSHMICLLSELSNLPIEYAYLDSFSLSKEEFIEVLKAFSNAQKGSHVDDELQKIKSLGLPIADGFSYQDTVYHKEEF